MVSGSFASQYRGRKGRSLTERVSLAVTNRSAATEISRNEVRGTGDKLLTSTSTGRAFIGQLG
jgi:hypothetical protein